jgi:hypothetical protein
VINEWRQSSIRKTYVRKPAHGNNVRKAISDGVLGKAIEIQRVRPIVKAYGHVPTKSVSGMRSEIGEMFFFAQQGIGCPTFKDSGGKPGSAYKALRVRRLLRGRHLNLLHHRQTMGVRREKIYKENGAL